MVALVRTASYGAAAGYQTYVMVKRGGVWLIRSFQHTPSAVATGRSSWRVLGASRTGDPSPAGELRARGRVRD